MKELKGLIVAMATPFDENEELDFAGVKPLCDKLIEDGADGIFCAGSMGECAALTVTERVEIALATVNAVAGRVPVVAGVGDVTTKAAVEAVKRLRGSGVDFISLVMPYYLRPSQEEMYAHVAAVIAASDIPVMAYNIPQNTGTDISAQMLGKLYRQDGLIGAKDSSGDLAKMQAFIEATGDDFAMICGSDPHILTSLTMGAKGAISAPANALTRISSAIYDLYMAGDMEGAKAAQADWDVFTSAIAATGSFPSTVKRATNHFTAPVGPARRPMLPICDKKFADALDEVKEVYAKYYPTRGLTL